MRTLSVSTTSGTGLQYSASSRGHIFIGQFARGSIVPGYHHFWSERRREEEEEEEEKGEEEEEEEKKKERGREGGRKGKEERKGGMKEGRKKKKEERRDRVRKGEKTALVPSLQSSCKLASYEMAYDEAFLICCLCSAVGLENRDPWVLQQCAK